MSLCPKEFAVGQFTKKREERKGRCEQEQLISSFCCSWLKSERVRGKFILYFGTLWSDQWPQVDR